MIFACELRSHGIASVNPSISKPCINPKQQKALPQGAKRVPVQPGPFCSQYAPNTGSSAGQKTQREGAEPAPSTGPFYAAEGLQTAVCINTRHSASQKLTQPAQSSKSYALAIEKDKHKHLRLSITPPSCLKSPDPGPTT